VKPIYETLPGWQTDISHVRRLADLPPDAIRYLQRITELVGRPIEVVSVGPDRGQTILVPAVDDILQRTLQERSQPVIRDLEPQEE